MNNPLPRIVPQINGLVVGAANCGPCTAAQAVDFATAGRIRVGPHEIRRRMRNLSGPTNVADQVRAIESYDDECIHVGLEPLVCRDHINGEWSDLRGILIRAEVYVGAVLDYGVVNDDPVGKRLSGDKAFRGKHFFGIFGYRMTKDGTKQVRVFDPLADGRRRGIPTGPSWWPLDLVHRAMEKASTSTEPGRVTYTVVPRAKALAKARLGVASEGFVVG